MNYYVSASAFRSGCGTKESPFKTIQEAANIAMPGDEVIVAPGVYREYVNPKHAGTENARITYRSEEMRGAVITGAEPVKNWERYQGDVYVSRIPNGIFGDYNPYTVPVSGDWYFAPDPVHTGEVYLNGKAMYEVLDLEKVLHPVVYRRSWDPEATLKTWYTKQEDGATLIFANFGGKNPNEENVEINVRRNVFYPSEEGIGYITVSGFVIRQAATQWAPPTAYQDGMIGPHWSKGWIIEDCEILANICSRTMTISGRRSTRRMARRQSATTSCRRRMKAGRRSGSVHILSAATTSTTAGRPVSSAIWAEYFQSLRTMRSTISITSRISPERRSAESRCMRLLMCRSAGTIFITAREVCGSTGRHRARASRRTCSMTIRRRPERISHRSSDSAKIFSSRFHTARRISTEGIAFVHNLIAGSFTWVGDGVMNNSVRLPSPRYTPYHVPHRTEVAGFMTIQHGDARFYNNIFVQQPVDEEYVAHAKECGTEKQYNFICGTKPYDGYPTAKAYFEQFGPWNIEDESSKDKFYDHMPVYTGGNVYFNGAEPCDSEEGAYVDETDHVMLKLISEDGHMKLETNLYDFLPASKNETISTAVLGEAFEPEEKFENPDGSPITFNQDYFGDHRAVNPVSGPFEGAAQSRKVLF